MSVKFLGCLQIVKLPNLMEMFQNVEKTNGNKKIRFLNTNLLLMLPHEVFLLIFGYLEPKTIFKVAKLGSGMYDRLFLSYQPRKDINEGKKILDWKKEGHYVKNYFWFNQSVVQMKKMLSSTSNFPNLGGKVCESMFYSKNEDYQEDTKRIVLERYQIHKDHKESIVNFIRNSSQRRQSSQSQRTKDAKKKELKELMLIVSQNLKKWCSKNYFHNSKFLFEVSFSCSPNDSIIKYGGEVDLSSSEDDESPKVKHASLVRECEIIQTSIPPKATAELVSRIGISEDGYTYMRNVFFKGLSGLPSYYSVEKEISKVKEMLYGTSRVIIGKDNTPVGVLTPISRMLSFRYEEEGTLADLCVRNWLFHNVYIDREMAYRNFRSKIQREHSVKVTQLTAEMNQLQKQINKLVDNQFNSTDGSDSEEWKRLQSEIDKLEKLQKEIEGKCWELNGCTNKLRFRIAPDKRIEELEKSLIPLLGKGRTKAVEREISEINKKIEFWKVEKENPERMKKFQLSKKYFLEREEDENGVFLHLGNVIRKSDDGHPIYKGGFAKTKANENVSACMFPSASFPSRLDNHDIISQVLGSENSDLFETTLQSVSDDTDDINGKIMESDFFVSKDYVLDDGKDSLLMDWLIDVGILRKSDTKSLRNAAKIRVKVTNTFIYSADWKGLLLCYENIPGLYNPFSATFKSERIIVDLQNPDKYPFVYSSFIYPERMFPLLLRSSAHLIYNKTIPTIARRADISLHGDVRLTNSALFQGLILAGLDHVGLKSKALQIFERYGLVGESTTSVSKKSPLKLSHIKVDIFHGKKDEFLKEMDQLYRKKKQLLEEKLKQETEIFENTNFRSEKSKKTRLDKLEKCKLKIQVCENLIDHHSSYLADLFRLLDILDAGNRVEHDEEYLRHSREWVEKEFLSFETIKDEIVPILSRIQKKLSTVTVQTGVCGYYFNHLVRTFVLYTTTFFHSRDNQRTMERLGYLLNRAYWNSSAFGGERKVKRKMVVAGRMEESIEVNRKIDTLIAAKAPISIKQATKRREFHNM